MCNCCFAVHQYQLLLDMWFRASHDDLITPRDLQGTKLIHNHFDDFFWGGGGNKFKVMAYLVREDSLVSLYTRLKPFARIVRQHEFVLVS